MTREQGCFLLERPCFLLGCICIETEEDCFSESYDIYLEWKWNAWGIVKSGDIGIIFIVRWKADFIKEI